MKIIFMGTPEFAVPTLQKLIENNLNIVAVVTPPDKPRGRGQKISPTPVKKLAVANKIDVLQPDNLNSEDFINLLSSYNPDLQVVVAFRMLPNLVWQLPPLGTINLHPSLLPDYRGAAPINWSIINGEKETGVTTFFIKETMDTGDIIFQEKQPIFENDTAGTLHDRLMHQGAELVLKTVKAIESGNFPKTPQIATKELHLAPKIHKEDCKINTTKSAEYLINFIRGLQPKPGAYFKVKGENFKIVSVIKPSKFLEIGPGVTMTDHNTYFAFGTDTDTLLIDKIQMPGRKPMDIVTFLNLKEIKKRAI